ncbi:MAG: dihydrolipoyllysine-residue succinyltransferase, partial [Bacteroidales bacterium]|nr:dihydrolipoyllysine-residue succinyltransferase [Bacteroidales bacterium]
SPLARKMLKEQGQSEAAFIDWLKAQRVAREDVEAFAAQSGSTAGAAMAKPAAWGGTRNTERKKMSTLRLKLAERLVSVKNDTAMLTTFNEVDMSAVMGLRKRFKEKFAETHGIGIGFMSFFTKAITIALNDFPTVNAMIAGDELVYHDYADIGIAVSTPKGLMVPVLRNAEQMSLAEIEYGIKALADKARNNKITLDDMKGGTFTITNGGVFGSMLSTPILNPPQSAILGMHNIVERPVAVSGKVEVRPVMYVALSYDHRVIDGRESVSFLVRVKELLEEPARMLLGGKDPVEALLDI